MFRKKKEQSFASVRTRQPKAGIGEVFRRNNVVISRSQREMAARQQSVTQRQQDRKKLLARRIVRNRTLALVGLCLIVALGYRMQITRVQLRSNASTKLTTELADQYQASILRAYHEHTVLGQSWLLDEAGLKSAITKQYPEIQWLEVSQTAPISAALKVDVRFRKPVFVWKDVSNTQQFVDANGVLFSRNLDPSVQINRLTQIEDQSGVALDAGASVLSTQLIQFIGQLHNQIPSVYGGGDVKVSRVIVPRSTREVQVQLSSQAYIVKLSSTRPLPEQVGELGSLLGYLKAKNITPAEYIDLRTPHKAFYK
ncbi:MAG: hypothetical protein U0520_00190 [Candidatus Saccharimonadales bacterium]